MYDPYTIDLLGECRFDKKNGSLFLISGHHLSNILSNKAF